ncbi:MAG TPA: L,D-transpeptidase family protein [Bacteroidales bacterium]|nr:L,D-transpeptidase family protein [Bacteroidales bacterium]HQP53108.1 L,D-transpeptidase family protein [Bacteroidales bacterium]
MTKKARITTIILVIIFVLLGAGTIIAINMKPEAPIAEVEMARQALALARNQKAETFAKETFVKAQQLYDSAMIVWNNENEKFFLKRDYQQVRELATLSKQQSDLAIEQAGKSFKNLETAIQRKLIYLNKLVSEIKVLSRFPLPLKITNSLSKGKLLLNEAQATSRDGMLHQANNKLNEAEKLLEHAHSKANSLIEDYFKNFDNWKMWKANTIRDSKLNKSVAIVVDKYAGKCFLYKNGALTHEFDAELGKNWLGNKRQKGDKVTPEGQYKITDKKENSRTKYYKALLINYPNDDDKKRFQNEVKNGSLAANSKIGNLIEIHGHGGKGSDWTDGCVALTNSDMDILFKVVQKGTPVTIIGSSITLAQIKKQ